MTLIQVQQALDACGKERRDMGSVSKLKTLHFRTAEDCLRSALKQSVSNLGSPLMMGRMRADHVYANEWVRDQFLYLVLRAVENVENAKCEGLAKHMRSLYMRHPACPEESPRVVNLGVLNGKLERA